jgi:hypothetical protein
MRLFYQQRGTLYEISYNRETKCFESSQSCCELLPYEEKRQVQTDADLDDNKQPAPCHDSQILDWAI